MSNGSFVIYGDTDSCFLHYGKLFEDLGVDISDDNSVECIKLCMNIDKRVKSIINTQMDDICNNIMLSPNIFNFESEEVVSRMLITSKKKYIAKIAYDKTTEKYLDHEFSIKGMEFKKSNLSDPVKEFLKDITIKIMDGATKNEIVKILKNKFLELPTLPIDDISYAQGVKNIEKYGRGSNIVITSPTQTLTYIPKHCPYHVAGALVLNALIDYDYDLREMDRVSEGDKGKIVFVTSNNIFGIKAITLSSTSKWHPKLYDYFSIDIQYLFERLILGPLKPALTAAGLNITIRTILGFDFLDSGNKFKQALLF